MRLSSESHSIIADVVNAYLRGKISANKSRELCERIVFDGATLDAFDPREIGMSEAEAIRRLFTDLTPSWDAGEVATQLGIQQYRASQLLSRLARAGEIDRVSRGRYGKR